MKFMRFTLPTILLFLTACATNTSKLVDTLKPGEAIAYGRITLIYGDSDHTENCNIRVGRAGGNAAIAPNEAAFDGNRTLVSTRVKKNNLFITTVLPGDNAISGIDCTDYSAGFRISPELVFTASPNAQTYFGDITLYVERPSILKEPAKAILNILQASTVGTFMAIPHEVRSISNNASQTSQEYRTFVKDNYKLGMMQSIAR